MTTLYRLLKQFKENYFLQRIFCLVYAFSIAFYISAFFVDLTEYTGLIRSNNLAYKSDGNVVPVESYTVVDDKISITCMNGLTFDVGVEDYIFVNCIYTDECYYSDNGKVLILSLPTDYWKNFLFGVHYFPMFILHVLFSIACLIAKEQGYSYLGCKKIMDLYNVISMIFIFILPISYLLL